MEAIALFTPDVFIVIVTLTALSFGWAMARTVFTLYPSPSSFDETRKQLRAKHSHIG